MHPSRVRPRIRRYFLLLGLSPTALSVRMTSVSSTFNATQFNANVFGLFYYENDPVRSCSYRKFRIKTPRQLPTNRIEMLTEIKNI